MMGMEMKTQYKGKIAGTEIKFTAEAEVRRWLRTTGRPQEMVAKKSALNRHC